MKWESYKVQKLQKISNIIICLFGLVIFIYLTFHSMTATWYMIPGSGFEIPLLKQDSIAVNLLILAVFVVALIVLNGLYKKRVVRKNSVRSFVLFVSASVQLILGLLHVFGADRIPAGDQAEVYNAAVSFLNSDYSLLLPENYMGRNPHQLGQAIIIQAFLSVFKSADYHLFQLLIVLMSTFSVFVIYSLIKELTGNDVLTIIGTVIAGFNPITVFYTSWLYGDLPSVFFMLLAALLVIRYTKRKKMSYLISSIVSMTISYLVRKNTLIFIAAFFLIAIVKGIIDKDRKLLIAGVCAVVVPVLTFHIIISGYEKASGIPHSDGLPTSSYLYIGISENDGRCGWYTYFPMEYYYNDCDTDKTSEVFEEKIRVRFYSMIHEPGYIKAFYGYKIQSQWNEPLYQAAYYNLSHDKVHMEKVVSFVDRLMAYHFDKLLFAEDKLQLIIYAGMLLYFLLSLKKSPDLTWHLLAVAIIGGFMFSVIWEAKARYSLPYYIMMFPMAMRGYYLLMEAAPKFKKKT